jgi:electron transfer flavoprotein beta subunit
VNGDKTGPAAAKVKRVDYFVPPMGKGAEMLVGSTAEIAEKLIGLLKAKGGLN